MRKILFAIVAALVLSASVQALDFSTNAYQNPRHAIFVSTMQRFVSMRDKGGEHVDKTKYAPTAFALGWQHAADRWTAGATMSYETGNVKMYDDDGYAKVRDQMLGFTLFGEYRFDCGYYAKASAFVGFANQKLKNGYYDNIDVYESDGTTHSTRFGASLEFGKRFDLANGFLITPHVGFDYGYYPGKGAKFIFQGDRYRINQPSQSVYEVPLGVTLAKNYAFCDWTITPSVDLTMITSIGNIKEYNRNARPGFASRTGSEWKVYGVGAGHWGGRITAGIQAVKAGRFGLDLKYSYEGRKKYNDHRLMANFGIGF
jgi:outer membrane autotransporter barrel domain